MNLKKNWINIFFVPRKWPRDEQASVLLKVLERERTEDDASPNPTSLHHTSNASAVGGGLYNTNDDNDNDIIMGTSSSSSSGSALVNPPLTRSNMSTSTSTCCSFVTQDECRLFNSRHLHTFYGTVGFDKITH